MTQTTDSGFPSFFAEAPVLRVREPLAGFLGASDGMLTYTYADAVKVAGHSCPTVASTFLLARAALRALYPDSLPVRGEIRVELRGAAHEGVNGPVGAVLGLLTGAAGEGGFHGLGGQFDRRGLLSYGAGMAEQACFTRLDTGGTVTATARPQQVPADPRLGELMQRCLAGLALAEEAALFRALWQDRVRRLLLQHAEDPAVLQVRRAAVLSERF